jgi:hypothetical protein
MLCASWIDESDVAECCAALVDSGSGGSSLLASAAEMASDILYRLSGEQYGGICEAVVRPCSDPCRCGWGQILASGHIVGFEDYQGRWYNECGRSCGCSRLSRIKLPGVPVISISEVLIDGIALAPSSADAEYRIDERCYLTRLADPDTGMPRWWPGCQRLDMPPTEIGTFQITYEYGRVAPAAGIAAARELACQLALAMACHDDCQLPQGVVRVVRQGVTVERAQIDVFGKGRTGLVLVDAFLGSYNPSGLKRRPAVWSPDVQRYARPV